MKNRAYSYIILSFFLYFLYSACSLAPRTENEAESSSDNGGTQVPEFTDNESVAESSSLFSAAADKHSYTFFTKDPKYIKSNGYTFWLPSHESSTDFFEPVELSAYKESGRTESGYGVVFCNQVMDGQDFLMCVMINTRGQFIIGKVIDGEFLTISNWKSSPLLHKGMGIKNTIKITYDNQKKVFCLSFNGYFACDFSPVKNAPIYGGKSGYVVVVSNLENFPKTPVKVVLEGVSGL